MRRSKIAAVAIAAWVFGSRSALAQLRLRGDAYVQSRSPVGLLVLQGNDRLRPAIDAETVTWLGITDSPSPTGDVLTLSVRLRDVRSGSELRAGRMLVSMGAVRPVHLDGARGLVRVFGGTTLEAFGGFPVARRFDYATFDWATGGRIGQSVGDSLAFGASYLHRRSDARRADEELGADVAFTPRPWLTAAGRAAFDLVSPGPTDVLGSIGVRSGDVRGELFTTHRSPGRLLPSTSLFSVLGDFASTHVGGTVRWLAFPRLELVATGSAQVQDTRVGGQGLGRVTLALDDDFAGSIGLETRRVEVGDRRWTGARVVISVPVRTRIRVASEIEMVVPDRPRGGPAVWPWVLGAVSYRIAEAWDAAAGLEASSGMTDKTTAVGLARLTYVFDPKGAR